MKIPYEVAERVITGTMKELWDTFVNLEGEYEEFEEDYLKIRFGINVYFEIQDLWEDTKRLIKKDKEGLIIINKRRYTITDFRTEKEERRKIMNNAIINNTEYKTMIEPRGRLNAKW